MKELIKNSEVLAQIKSGELTAAVISHIVACGLGLVCSRAAIDGNMLPFGVSALAASPGAFMPSVAVGSFIGYFIPAISGGGFRYVAALLAVLTIRILLSGFRAISKSPIFVCAVAFLSLAVTAPVLIGSRTAISLIAETFLSAGGAYFLRITAKALIHRKAGFSQDELFSFLICAAIILVGLGRISLFGIYFYRILCVFLILVAAKYGGPAVSAGAGIAAAMSVFMVSRDMPVCLIAVMLGISTGVFRIYGKLVLSLVGTATALVGMMITDNALHPAFLVETLLAAAAFFCLPKGFKNEFGKLLSFYPKITLQSDLKKAVKLKLLDAAAALSDVKTTVNEVSDRLSVITAPDFSGMVGEIEERACAGCKLRIHCWETKKEATSEAVVSVIDAEKQSKENVMAELPDEFKARCFKKEHFCRTALSVYGGYAKSLAAENRAKEIRDVVSEQFEGISIMLKETAEDIAKCERFDRSAASAAAAGLKELDIIPSEAVCRIDKLGRRFIKIKASADNDTVINKMQVMRVLSLAAECEFSPPVVTKKDGEVFISAVEAPAYKVETGVYQIAAGGGSMCGDSYRFLTDGNGRFFAVLSDGMGTGGAAAVDSALSSGLVTRLIRSGINLDSALKIINSSMLFKSTYESTATLDIACIDLYTGVASVYKAGAAPTLIKHGLRIASATGRSLPIGILNDVHFERADIKLKNKDIVLMMSDGATGEGTEWIKRELENCGDISAQGLSENIALAARRRRSDRHEDDITVISVIMEKAV